MPSDVILWALSGAIDHTVRASKRGRNEEEQQYGKARAISTLACATDKLETLKVALITTFTTKYAPSIPRKINKCIISPNLWILASQKHSN